MEVLIEKVRSAKEKKSANRKRTIVYLPEDISELWYRLQQDNHFPWITEIEKNRQ